MKQTNPIDKGLEETIKSVMKEFDESGIYYHEDTTEYYMGCESMSGGECDCQIKDIKDFIKSSLTIAFTRGRESVKSLDKK